MTTQAGYQSDLKLSDQTFDGNLPIENAIGGYGIAQGVNNYTLTLNPPLSKSYGEGLPLMVRFAQTNTAAATLNVDQKGARPIKRKGTGGLVNLPPATIKPHQVYLLVFDGVVFQLVTLPGMGDLPVASESNAGIAQIATDQDMVSEKDDTKIVTVLKLLGFVQAKIAAAGHWTNMGSLSGASLAGFPGAKAGAVFTISNDGFIGPSPGKDGLAVKKGDVLFCLNDNAGGTQKDVGEDWNLIQGKLHPATQASAGILALATPQEMDDLTTNAKIVTPLRLKDALDYFEAQLKTFIQNEFPLKAEPPLGNPAKDGQVLSSSKSGQRAWVDVSGGGTDTLFNNLGTVDTGLTPGTIEITLNPTYTLPAAELRGSEGLLITMNGFLKGSANKTMRVLIGTKELLSNKNIPNPEGPFHLQIRVWRISTRILKGFSMLIVNGQNAESQTVQTSSLTLDTQDHVIKMTGRSPSGVASFLTRYTFVVQKLK